MLDSDPAGWKDFGRINHTFIPNFKLDRIKNTDTVLQLRIHSGEWIVSNVSLRPAVNTGFSPDEFSFRVPIHPNTLRPDNWAFLIQYLDINGILIIAVPNFNAPEKFYFEDDWAAYDLPRHLYHFDSESLEKTMTALDTYLNRANKIINL